MGKYIGILTPAKVLSSTTLRQVSILKRKSNMHL